MHTIYDCVNSFCSLLDTEYYLVLGRKGVAVELGIRFSKKDCFHLMGLQYLTDMPNLSRNRGKIFDEIREQKITQKQVGASDHYSKIAERIDLFPYLEDLFDSNDMLFKYNEKMNTFSMIQADYLMKNQIQGKTFFFFWQKIKRRIIISVVLFFRRVKEITQRIRHRGHFYTKRKQDCLQGRKIFYMIG